MGELINKDWIDSTRVRAASLGDLAVGTALSATTVPLIAEGLVGYDARQFPLGALMYGIVLVSPVSRFINSYFHPPEVDWVSEDLKYTFTPNRYRGSSRQIGEVGLRENDGYLLINMPQASTKKRSSLIDSPDVVSVMSDLNRFVFERGLERAKERGIDVVAIKGSTPPGPFSAITTAELYENSGFKFSKPQENLTILTKEQLAILASDPAQLFMQGVQVLNDKIAMEYLEEARNTTDIKVRKRAVVLLQERVWDILCGEVNNYDSQVTIIKREENGLPIKKKEYPVQEVTYNEGVFYLDERSESRQLIHREPLEETVKPYESLEEMATDQSLDKNSRGRIAHTLLTILQKVPLEELFRQKDLSGDDIKKKLKELGIKLTQASSHRLEIDPNSLNKYLKDVKRRSVIPLAVLAVYAMTLPATHLLNELGKRLPESVEYIATKDGTGTGIATLNSDDLPRHGLEWRLEAHGDILTGGYYIENTNSSLIPDKGWEVIREGKTPTSFPVTVDRGKPFIAVQNRIALKPGSSSSMKLPVKDNTKIGALSVTKPSGELANFKVYSLVDGTYELVIDNPVLETVGFVDIEMSLIESDKPEVKATKRADEMDISKINPTIREMVSNLIEENPDNYQVATAEAIRDRFTYSLALGLTKRYENMQWKEGVINLIGARDICDCDVCNSYQVLLSSFDPNPDTKLVRATGFLHNIDNPAAGYGSFLLNETRHAFGINQDGVILDATPNKVANDALTLRYIKLLLPTIGEDNTTPQENEWTEKKTELAKTEGVIRGTKLSGLMALFGVGYFIGSRGYRFGRRTFTEENLNSFMDDVLVRGLSKSDMRFAFNFFTGVSWSDYRGMNLDAAAPEGDKMTLLKIIRRNVNDHRLDFYDKSPRRYEELAGLSLKERMVTRFMSKFLVFYES